MLPTATGNGIELAFTNDCEISLCRPLVTEVALCRPLVTGAALWRPLVTGAALCARW